MDKGTVKTRNPNMELLRIIAMLLILCYHYVYCTDILELGNKTLVWGINSFSICCVDIFVLVTGWFYKQSSKEVSLKNAVKKTVFLDLKTLFYSILFFVVAVLAFKQDIYPTLIVETFLPISCKAFWFLTAYVVLVFIIPFLDKLINNITVKEHFFAVIVILCTVSLPATLFPVNWLTDTTEGFSFFWFLCLYIIGALLKRIEHGISVPTWAFAAGYFGFSGLLFAFYCSIGPLCDYLGIGNRATRPFRYTSFPVLMAAVCLLLLCSRIRIRTEKFGKVICAVSSVTFDIYIMHSYELAGRNIYVGLLKADRYYNSPVPIVLLHFAVSVVVIFTVGTFIALLCKLIYKVPFEYVSRKAGELTERIENRITKR